MQLRAAIRYCEFRNAKRLPPTAKFNCKECIDKGWQEKRNCDGEKTNPKYTVSIGRMIFDQCPVSVPSKEAWDVIELVTTSEDTGIPITGTCLLDQTPAFFEFRRIINSEKAECMEEINEMRQIESSSKARQQNVSNKAGLGSRRRK